MMPLEVALLALAAVIIWLAARCTRMEIQVNRLEQLAILTNKFQRDLADELAKKSEQATSAVRLVDALADQMGIIARKQHQQEVNNVSMD